MKKQIIKKLKAFKKAQEVAGYSVSGKCYLEVFGTEKEFDDLLSDLKNEGWKVYGFSIEIGNLQIGLFLR